jgi:Zn-dependent protease
LPFNIDIADLLLRVPVILLALTVHEFSHAYFALRMGDPTAYRQGRCSLNPLRHLDFLGTICLLFAPIGWAKPVPVNPANFRDPRKGDMIVSAAGPLSNLAQAVVFALVLRAVLKWGPGWAATEQGHRFVTAVLEMALLAVQINIGLAVFNLLPLYPLDGFHVSLQLMSAETQRRYLQIAHYGPFVILALVFAGAYTHFNVLRTLIEPPFRLVMRYVAGVDIG